MELPFLREEYNGLRSIFLDNEERHLSISVPIQPHNVINVLIILAPEISSVNRSSECIVLL